VAAGGFSGRAGIARARESRSGARARRRTRGDRQSWFVVQIHAGNKIYYRRLQNPKVKCSGPHRAPARRRGAGATPGGRSAETSCIRNVAGVGRAALLETQNATTWDAAVPAPVDGRAARAPLLHGTRSASTAAPEPLRAHLAQLSVSTARLTARRARSPGSRIRQDDARIDALRRRSVQAARRGAGRGRAAAPGMCPDDRQRSICRDGWWKLLSAVRCLADARGIPRWSASAGCAAGVAAALGSPWLRCLLRERVRESGILALRR